MKYFLLKNTQFIEFDIEKKEYKELKKKKLKNYITFVGQDLQGEDIILYHHEYSKFKHVAERLLTLRFAAADMRKKNLILILLFLFTLFFGFQYSNYYGQVKNYKLLEEQKNNIPVTPVDPTVTPVDPTVTPVDPTVTPVDPTVTPVDPTVTPVDPTVELQKKELEKQLMDMSLAQTKADMEANNTINQLTTQLEECKKNTTCKSEFELYKEIEAKFTSEKKEELKNIVKYEYLDEARKLAIESCKN